MTSLPIGHMYCAEDTYGCSLQLQQLPVYHKNSFCHRLAFNVSPFFKLGLYCFPKLVATANRYHETVNLQR